MGFLMTDMAAGSNAVAQMQQNVAGAPYAQQNAAAQAELLQNKVQEEKAKTEEEQANTQRTRMANLVTQAGLDITSNTQDTLKQVQADPTFKDKSPGEQAKTVASKLMVVNPEEAVKVLNAASAFDLKAAQEKIATQTAAHDQLSNAFAVIDGASDAQVPELLKQMSDEQKSAIKAQIPKFFDEADPKLQKKQLQDLMLTAKGWNVAAQDASRAEVERIRDAARVEVEQMRDQVMMERRMAGSGDKEGDREFRQASQVEANIQRIDSRYYKKEEDAHLDTRDAFTAARTTGFFGGYDGKAIKTYQQAYAKEMDIGKQHATEVLKSLELYPPSETRNRAIEQQKLILQSYNEPAPDPKDNGDKPKGTSNNRGVTAGDGSSKDTPLPTPTSKADVVPGKWYMTPKGPQQAPGGSSKESAAKPTTAPPATATKPVASTPPADPGEWVRKNKGAQERNDALVAAKKKEEEDRKLKEKQDEEEAMKKTLQDILKGKKPKVNPNTLLPEQ